MANVLYWPQLWSPPAARAPAEHATWVQRHRVTSPNTVDMRCASVHALALLRAAQAQHALPGLLQPGALSNASLSPDHGQLCPRVCPAQRLCLQRHAGPGLASWFGRLCPQLVPLRRQGVQHLLWLCLHLHSTHSTVLWTLYTALPVLLHTPCLFLNGCTTTQVMNHKPDRATLGQAQRDRM